MPFLVIDNRWLSPFFLLLMESAISIAEDRDKASENISDMLACLTVAHMPIEFSIS